MTTTLAPRPTLLRCELLEQGLSIPADLTFEEWQATLERAEWIERASPWWVVDLLAFGRAKFGEDYSQALPDAAEDPDGIRQSKLKQAEWMADRWPASTRVPEQSYSAHRAVAKLNRDDAVALLEMTDRDGKRLTVRELVKRADAVQEAGGGRAFDATGTEVTPEPLIWQPAISDLTAEARAALEANAPGGRHRLGYEQGFLRGLVFADARTAFKEWRE
jgi:hypothetical protein